jgi:hypothetical protein
MATKEEIESWLEACGARRYQYLALEGERDEPSIWWLADIKSDAEKLSEINLPLHLLNPSLTAVQGPTFAEWKKQKLKIKEEIGRLSQA